MSALRFKHILRSFALLACAATAPGAFAHAHLESEVPADKSEVSTPKELRLTFSEGVEKTFSKVVISRDGAGESTEIIPTQMITTDDANKKILIVTPVMPLVPGKYKVEWHAVSVDTHKSEGVYRFTVTP
jgi:methionine-rich copper-binding protein CopC